MISGVTSSGQRFSAQLRHAVTVQVVERRGPFRHRHDEREQWPDDLRPGTRLEVGVVRGKVQALVPVRSGPAGVREQPSFTPGNVEE
ncbi:hypothetical protein [Promicromonospora panici]|uniref:hypothetical protein n=1 Tax=Promicromonospora panici TaxID=2219658 RepID=UPI00101E1C24|nr:hypothetical protein [Promicromonospora panici]